MSPRLLPALLALLVSGPAAFAIDFGGLSKAIDSTKKATKALDTAKDAGKVIKGVAGIGPEEERSMGDAVALEVIAKYGGLVREADSLRRINLVGHALARYSDRPQLDWRFGVLNSDTVNAFSAPDGYVFITRGLYAQADGDDALAAILGHEIAHITGKHALNIVARNDAFGALNKQVAEHSANARALDAQLQQLNLSTDLILKTLLEKGFDPQTEYAADKIGHDLAALCGYAPGGLRAVLTRLQLQGENRKTMFSTHPALAERIKRLPNEPAPVNPSAPPPDAKDKPGGETK